MAIPSWQEILLPLLSLTKDGSERELSSCRMSLGDYFQLTRNERSELLPNGGHRVFDNRVDWAKAYLIRAKILESTGHGRFRITERGSAILGIEPKQLNLKFLSLFEEIRQFRNPQIDKVFISHGQDTLPFCEEIVRGLKVKNMDAWYDENNLDEGHIMERIE
jgi:restriction endonuclease Mrr